MMEEEKDNKVITDIPVPDPSAPVSGPSSSNAASSSIDPLPSEVEKDNKAIPGPSGLGSLGHSSSKEMSFNINSLPSELLFPIMKYLPYKDRINATEVSTRWHYMVDEHLGRKLFVGNFCQFTPDDEERYRHHYIPISNLSKLGVNTCYVGEIVDPASTMNAISYFFNKFRELFGGQSLPKFKHPHLVKNVFFDGPLPDKFFDSIIRPTKNLERLDIHWSALCRLNPANMDFPPFNKLNTLNIWGHKLTQGNFSQYYSGAHIVANLLILLDHNLFPSLKNFAMEYPFDLREESAKVTDGILEFLKKHKATLSRVKLAVNIFITEEPAEFDSAEDRIWIMKAKAASKLLKLKHIELSITSIYRVRLSKIWNAFVEGQTGLETVSVLTFRLDPSFCQRICEQNFRTLKFLQMTRLTLNSDHGRFVPFDCSMFEHCTALTRLSLEGMPSGQVVPEAGLINFKSIPKNLERIDIGTLTITSEDTHYLLTSPDFKNLHTVFLGDIGHQEEFGVKVETIEQVVQERRIPFITLYGCINGRLPEEGLSNGSPENEVFINIRYYGMLELKLNPQGYYEPVPREVGPLILMDDTDD